MLLKSLNNVTLYVDSCSITSKSFINTHIFISQMTRVTSSDSYRYETGILEERERRCEYYSNLL